MDIYQAIIFGIVEGITEFLPISSTGHLILTADILKIAQTDFLKSFEIAIQLGAILAVIVLYGRSLLVNKEILKRVMAAFIPTAILGLVFYKIVKKFFLGNSTIVLWALFIGGIVLIIFDSFNKENDKTIDSDLARLPYKTAVCIGCFQAIALIPGVSRAAATIIGGLILGMRRKAIVEFSFLLAVPTMLAATGLDLVKNAQTFSLSQLHFLAAGFISAFIVALFSIKFLLHYIQRHNFVVFGWYRVIISLLFPFIR